MLNPPVLEFEPRNYSLLTIKLGTGKIRIVNLENRAIFVSFAHFKEGERIISTRLIHENSSLVMETERENSVIFLETEKIIDKNIHQRMRKLHLKHLNAHFMAENLGRELDRV